MKIKIKMSHAPLFTGYNRLPQLSVLCTCNSSLELQPLSSLEGKVGQEQN